MKGRIVDCPVTGTKVNKHDRCPDIASCDDCTERKSIAVTQAKAAKKNAPKKHTISQTEEFSNLTPEPIFGHADKETGDLSFEDLIRGYREGRFKNEEGLRACVAAYQDAVGRQNLYNSEAVFFQKAAAYYGADSEEYKRLTAAFNGDIEALQQEIKKNPDILLLPFAAKAIIALLDNYKHSPKTGRSDIKKTWEGFLSLRGGGKKNPYPSSDIVMLVKYAETDMRKRGQKVTRKAAVKKVAEHLGISDREVFNAISEVKLLGKK